MTAQQYLQALLEKYSLKDSDYESVKNKREAVESFLRADRSLGPKIDRFYYSGSYAKKTAINLDYDLDLCVYYKQDSFPSLREMYSETSAALKRFGQVDERNVSIRLPQGKGLSVDIVPGRLISAQSDDINLYSRLRDSQIKSNIPKHKEYISNSDCRDVIKLMKIWKHKCGIHYKSFALELLVIEALKGYAKNDFDPALQRVFSYAESNVETIKLVDPANSNNNVSDSIEAGDKINFKNQASAANRATNWADIFKER